MDDRLLILWPCGRSSKTFLPPSKAAHLELEEGIMMLELRNILPSSYEISLVNEHLPYIFSVTATKHAQGSR